MNLDDHSQLYGTLRRGPAHRYVLQLYSKASSFCIIMSLSRVLIESGFSHPWHWRRAEQNLQKCNNCRIIVLVNTVNVAICLLDAPFDGCHNSKIVSLCQFINFTLHKRLHQVLLLVYFIILPFFLFMTTFLAFCAP